MTTPSPETRWTEADYQKAGYKKLGLRVSQLAHIRLGELAEAADTSKAEVVEDLIAAEYARHERAKP